MSMSAGWYPLALAEGIEPGTSAGTQLFGKELVVWRDAEGAAHVWEDRCPHRGMRLSFGFVRGDRMACLYHGWQFDGAGQCRAIPAHPHLDVPETIRVTTYRVAERAGVIWAADAQTEAPEPAGRDGLAPIRSLYVDRPLAAVRAALAGAGFPGADGAPLPFAGETGGLLAFGAPEPVLFAALQPFAAGRTALHILAAGAPAAEDRVALAAASEVLRRALEGVPALAEVAA